MYPKHGKPGDEITWTQDGTQRAGVVMCRAELVEPERFYSSWTRSYEERMVPISGVFLWVIPTDGGTADTQGCVAIRTWLSGRNAGRFEYVPPAVKVSAAA